MARINALRKSPRANLTNSEISKPSEELHKELRRMSYCMGILCKAANLLDYTLRGFKRHFPFKLVPEVRKPILTNFKRKGTRVQIFSARGCNRRGSIARAALANMFRLERLYHVTFCNGQHAQSPQALVMSGPHLRTASRFSCTSR